jgi:3-phenylpropionate/trans-cinnamate dioxygenase ferredoxin reductase subunit
MSPNTCPRCVRSIHPESKGREYYEDNEIDLLLKTRATHLNRADKVLSLSNDTVVSYDRLLIATGARPSQLAVPGTPLAGVMTFRSLQDALALRNLMRLGRRIVIIGGGLLGYELAASCSLQEAPVTLLVSKSRLLPGIGSDAFAGFMAKRLVERGVEIVYNDEAVFFAGSGNLKSVHTRMGREIDAIAAVEAIGVVPNSDWLADSGIERVKDGGIVADRYLQTNDPSIWTAGDVACHDDAFLGGRHRFEHHLNAKWQGRAVGATMAGNPTAFEAVPYIYSDVFDIHVNLRGRPTSGEPNKVLGSYETGEFVELFASSAGKIVSSLAVSHDDTKLDGISDAMEGFLREKTALNEVQFGDLASTG